MSDAFTGLMDSLAKHLGLEPDDSLESPVDMTIDDMVLTLAYDAKSGGDDLILYAELGQVPLEHELDVYRTLLEGNLLWSATADATIGVNSATREAMMAYKMPIEEVDGAGLATIAAQFIEIAKRWRDFITAAGEFDEADNMESPAFGSDMIRA